MPDTMTSVITGTVIPKDLAGIDGIEVGFNPPSPNESRLLITGTPGSGKSTFLNSNAKLLMIDIEAGGRTVADPLAMRYTPPPNIAPIEADLSVVAFVDKIIARKIKGATDIAMIGFDSADELVSLFQRALCLRASDPTSGPLGLCDIGDWGGGHGKGYSNVRETIANMLDRIHRAGLGWAVIAHTTTKTVTIGKEEILVSSLAVSDTYKSMFIRKCEHFLFVEAGAELIAPPPTVTEVKGHKHTKIHAPVPVPCRFIKTAPGGIWKGGEATELKIRVPLPDRIKLPQIGGFGTFSKAYERAVKQLMENHNVG